jgi:hypothetical protein
VATAARRRHGWPAALACTGVALLLASCGDQNLDLPSAEVGRSTHFRYYARATDRLPVGILDLLEAHWTQMSAFFRLDQNLLVNYYLFDSPDDLVTDGPCRSACAPTGAALYTDLPFDEHELIHTYLASLGSTAPIVAEGVASGLSCFDHYSLPEIPPPDPSWQAAASNFHVDSTDYGQSRLVRYLIRHHGPEAFASFYRYAEQTLDPGLFALQFERFWGESIDTAWAAATAPQVSPTYLDVGMCGCSEAELPVDGGSVPVAPLYGSHSLPRPFTLAMASDLAVSMQDLGRTAIRNCWDEDYAQRIIRSDMVAPPSTVILHVPAGHYYVQAFPASPSPGSVSIRRGAWLARDCTAGESFSVDSGFAGSLEVETPGSPSFLHLSVAGPRTATVRAGPSTFSLCPACDSPPADCTTVAPLTSATVTLDGSHVLKLDSGVRASFMFQ